MKTWGQVLAAVLAIALGICSGFGAPGDGKPAGVAKGLLRYYLPAGGGSGGAPPDPTHTTPTTTKNHTHPTTQKKHNTQNKTHQHKNTVI